MGQNFVRWITYTTQNKYDLLSLAGKNKIHSHLHSEQATIFLNLLIFRELSYKNRKCSHLQNLAIEIK